MGLSTKQKAFIDAYFRCGFNGTMAAIMAGYSENTAAVIASENLKKPNISEAIARRLKENTISADEALQRLSDQAVGDLGDYIDDEGILDMERVRSDGKTHLIKEYTFNETFNEKSDTRYTRTSIKLYDAQSALKEIIRLHRLDKGLPTENVQVVMTTGMNVDDL